MPPLERTGWCFFVRCPREGTFVPADKQAHQDQAILHRDSTSENHFMLYETWESHEDVLDVQLHRSYRQAWHDALPRVLQQQRDITIWEPMRSDRKHL